MDAKPDQADTRCKQTAAAESVAELTMMPSAASVLCDNSPDNVRSLPVQTDTSDASNSEPLKQTVKTAMQPPPRPTRPMSIQSPHSRSLSLANITTQRSSKRLSLNLAIQPPQMVNSLLRGPPSISPGTDKEKDNAVNSGNFLVALAAQERRVLELREALTQAEEELDKLKRSWTLQEAAKSRRITDSDCESVGTQSPRRYSDDQEIDAEMKKVRREEIMKSMNRTSQRKLFSGNRHARTLSLLAPEKYSSMPFESSLSESKPSSPMKDILSPTESTDSLVSSSGDLIMFSDHGHSNPTSGNRDGFFTTGKQIAEEFKDGLWTFIEDIRQAAVGDDASMSSSATRRSSISKHGKVSPGRSSKRHSIGHSPRNHNKLDTPSRSPLIPIKDFNDKTRSNTSSAAVSPSPAQGQCDNNLRSKFNAKDHKEPGPENRSPTWSASTYVSEANFRDTDTNSESEL
jgi:hypothetical protein